jgi:mannose-1-phosphate guanylyltransferase/phosphomannomutase
MKAVIMAGGMGTRLRAVTGDRPKPMVEVLGKPIMEHIIELLVKNGIDDICVAVRYKAGDIMGHFGDGGDFGVRLKYAVENEPLGTAGAVKNCEDFYSDGEDFLVISGDAACDFNLRELIFQHKKRRSKATIALYQHPEPLNYGLVVTDSEGWVQGFVEKPDWSRVVTNQVNTGIYVLSPEVMELVPRGREYDFAKDLFPKILKAKGDILGQPLEGYWCDIGTPAAYYQCCADALEGKLKIQPAEIFQNKAVGAVEDKIYPGEGLVYDCDHRAELMGILSKELMDMGADYTDGLQLHGKGYDLRISPMARQRALRISVSSADTEFARHLAVTAKNLVKALDESGE